MNNSEYHRAGKTVLNWKHLSIPMKARYDGWITHSLSVWTAKFVVTITKRNGKTLKETVTYPFETRAYAEECLEWWQDNNCYGEIKEI